VWGGVGVCGGVWGVGVTADAMTPFYPFYPVLGDAMTPF